MNPNRKFTAFGVSYYSHKTLIASTSSYYPLKSRSACYVGGWRDGVFHGQGELHMAHPEWNQVRFKGSFTDGMVGDADVASGANPMSIGTLGWKSGNTLMSMWNRAMSRVELPLHRREYEAPPPINRRVAVSGKPVSFGTFNCVDPSNVTEMVTYSAWEKKAQLDRKPHRIQVFVNTSTSRFMMKTQFSAAVEAWNEYKALMKSYDDNGWPFNMKFTVDDNDAYCMTYFPLRCSNYERAVFTGGSNMMLYEIDRKRIEEIQTFLHASNPADINFGSDCGRHSDYNEFLVLDVVGVHNPTLEREWYYQSFQRKSSDADRARLRRLLEAQLKQHEEDSNLTPNKFRFSLISKTRVSKFIEQYPDAIPDQTRARNQASYNPQYLFHGTANPLAINKIMQHGFTHSRRGGQFGSGLYLADDFAKSDQYMTLDRIGVTNAMRPMLDGKNAMMKLIDHHNTINNLKELGAVRNDLSTSPAGRQEQVYVMLIVKANLGSCLHLVFNEEIATLHDPKGSRPKVAPDGLELGGEFERFRKYHYAVNADGSDYTGYFKQAQHLRSDFDSVFVQDWGHDVGFYGSQNPREHRLRYPEYVLYGEDCNNAIPVAVVFYIRRKNTNKPCVKAGANPKEMSISVDDVPGYSRDTRFDQERYYIPELPPTPPPGST